MSWVFQMKPLNWTSLDSSLADLIGFMKNPRDASRLRAFCAFATAWLCWVPSWRTKSSTQFRTAIPISSSLAITGAIIRAMICIEFL